MTRYLAYPGDAKVYQTTANLDGPNFAIKTANGRVLRPFDVTPSPIAVAVHAALKGWK